jgi:hypothetical protein
MNANRQTVEIVVPVHDEEAALEPNVELLLGYLGREFPFRFRVVIADNASRDLTPAVAAQLANRHPQVSVLRLERKGRGLALRTAWLASRADVVSYMDVDLSTNLESFLPLVAPIVGPEPSAGRAPISAVATTAATSATTNGCTRRPRACAAQPTDLGFPTKARTIVPQRVCSTSRRRSGGQRQA